MENLQKDLAIFKAMYGFANEYFTAAVNSDEGLQKLVADNSNVVSTKQLMNKNSDLARCFNTALRVVADEVCHIEIDTFDCQFRGDQVFELLEYWKSLAKVKGEIIFTYEESIDLPLVTTVSFAFDNASNAKKLAKCTAQEEFRPLLQHILVELNLDTEVVNFVASDGHVLSLITTDKIAVHRNNPNDHVLMALFAAKDWERICDYAKKNGNAVEFEFYYHNENQANDTCVAVFGETRIKSTMQGQYNCDRYPNWHRIIPFYEDYQHIRLTKESVKDFANYFKRAKSDAFHVVVSVYEGCKYLYIDETDYYFGKNITAKFELETPATSDLCFGASKQQMQKFQTEGWWIGDADKGAILDSKEFDMIMLMPCLDGDGNPCSIDKETADERRGYPLHKEVVEEVAETVELEAVAA